MKKAGIEIILLVLLVMMGAGGCGKRELEDRSFPSVLLIEKGNLEETIREAQEESSLYLDFGHTKAAIIDEEVWKDRAQCKEMLLYLEQHPIFARNLLLFCGDGEIRSQAGKKEEGAGEELEDLYKNQPKDQRQEETTLQDALNFLHNQEEELKIPRLAKKEGALILDGEITVSWENTEDKRE